MDAFLRILGTRTRVVAVAHASNVLGTLNPVGKIADLARSVGAISVIDGAQAIPHLSLDMTPLNCDFYAVSAHKMLGPTGLGVLYGRREVLEGLEPTRGGSEMIKEVWIDRARWNDLPWRFEPGTPPIAEAVGLTAAIEYLDKLGMHRVAEHEQALTRRALKALGAIDRVARLRASSNSRTGSRGGLQRGGSASPRRGRSARRRGNRGSCWSPLRPALDARPRGRGDLPGEFQCVQFPRRGRPCWRGRSNAYSRPCRPSGITLG